VIFQPYTLQSSESFSLIISRMTMILPHRSLRKMDPSFPGMAVAGASSAGGLIEKQKMLARQAKTIGEPMRLV